MNQSHQYIVNASAHEIPLPDGMIHTVCTSPPYYSLRLYAGQQEVDWPSMCYPPMPGVLAAKIPAMRCDLGLEPTLEAYIGHLVYIFREVKRVLRDDGVVWCVMGDSYAGSGDRSSGGKGFEHMQGKEHKAPDREIGLHQGDLMMIPHRLALALQADGWIVRNDVVWSKKSPMPESVSGWRWERCRVKVRDGIQHSGGTRGNASGTFEASLHTPNRYATWADCPGCDKCRETGGYVLRRGSWRHTRAHETVLMLAKEMGYFADQERVREEYSRLWGENNIGPNNAEVTGKLEAARGKDLFSGLATTQPSAGRNPRSVLTPSPESYPGSHYAVYPRTLIAPLIRATAPTRCCPVCGAPWCPVVEREFQPQGDVSQEKGIRGSGNQKAMCDDDSNQWQGFPRGTTQSYLLGYRPTCDHDADPVPGWCLDPFAGTFTTGAVCAELGVNCIGLDISPEYLDEHAKPRIGLTPARALEELPLFAGIWS